MNNFVGSECGEHVQRDRFHGGAGISTVTAFATDVRRDLEGIQIDSGD
jgi:hypothetical protein